MLRDAPVTTVLIAKDINRAREFYTGKLGLRLMALPTPKDSAAFESGNGTMLYLYEQVGGTRANHTAAIWLVRDIEKTAEKMRKKGVVFEQYNRPGLKTNENGIAESDGAKSAWFKDSEGNILAVTEISG
jgi:catechol 2,3-dioxygenase-like lactoylglutathione lyase family enzyme